MISDLFPSKRIQKLIQILRDFDIQDVMNIESAYDEQHKYLQKLFDRIKDIGIFLTLIILNALSSYMLNCTGEEYWREFSEYFSTRASLLQNTTNEALVTLIINEFKNFLANSRCNKRFLKVKISRLEKVKTVVNRILENHEFFIKNQSELLSMLSKQLSPNKYSKTVTFAVKMFNYGLRICLGKEILMPWDAPIPVDKRIEFISRKLGVQDDIMEFWNRISRIVCIPPLHIDSLLWVGYRFAKRKKLTSNNKFNALIRFLIKIIEDP